MTTSKKLKIYLPHAERANRNYARSRFRWYLKELIEASEYEVVTEYSNDVDIIHFPSVFEFQESGNVVHSKNGIKKYIIHAFTDSNEFEYTDDGVPRLKKECLKIYNEAFTVIVFFENQKISLRHFGVTAPITIIHPIGRKIESNDEIFKTAFKKSYGLFQDKKYIVNYGDYSSIENFDDYENLARIMPDLEFFFFGNRPTQLRSVRKYEDGKAIKNIHFEKSCPEELVASGIYSLTTLVITSSNFLNALLLADCMINRRPIIINGKNMMIDEMIKNHTVLFNSFDDLYNGLHDILDSNKIEEAYEYINQTNVDTEKEKLIRIYDKYLILLN